jgi:hypothetical protein
VPPPPTEAIIFIRVPNKPDGQPGIHFEPFMYHFGNSAHVAGAHIVRLSPPAPGGQVTDLTEDFVGAEEPEVSCDAQKIIFSGKRGAQDPWEVWEMNADGSGKRQITKGMGDVCSPYYLPDGRILFSSTRHVAMKPERRRDEYDRDSPRLAHRCNADGSAVEQLTFNLSSDSEFVVLRDGRVLFQSWQHHGVRFHASGASAFFTMSPDGTGFIDFFGNQRGQFRWKQREMPDGKIVYIESVFHTVYGGGQLGLITPGDPSDPATAENLTPDIPIYSDNPPGGRYRDPYPLTDGRLIVSWSPPPTWGTTPAGPKAQFGLYWFDLGAKKRGAPIYDDPKFQSLNAVALAPHPKPRIVPDHPVKPGERSGTLTCLNAYEGQLDKEAFIRPGQIKKVRIIEGFGVHDADPNFRTFPPGIGYSSFGSSTNSISNFEQKRMLGEAPVEADGSFYLKVPADTVLHWQTLDDNGMALQDALTWIWVRPGENRQCVGCHEPRSVSPDFRSTPLAARRPPPDMVVPEEKRITVDFRRDLAPILSAKCVRCHNEPAARSGVAGLDLSGGNDLVFMRVMEDSGYAYHINAAVFSKAYLNLSSSANFMWGKLIYPGSARKSPLIWRLYGRSFLYDAAVNQCPPDQPLTPEEKARFALWVDLGAQWDNLPGMDDLPTYSAEASAKQAAEVAKTILPLYTDAAAATEMRCMQCHPLMRVLSCRKSPQDWKTCVQKMHEKNKDWIKPQEVDLVANYVAEITGNAGLIRNWKVCGPFDNSGGAGLRSAFGPETELDFAKTYPGKGGKPAAWKDFRVDEPTGLFHFGAVVGDVGEATAYAYAPLPSDRDRVAYLRLTGSDMFEVILNGRKIMQRLVSQPFWYDWDIVPLALVAGPNHLLIKVHRFGGQWSLRARIAESPSRVARAAVLEAPKPAPPAPAPVK